MPLINCPDCGQKISDSARDCKNCGFPIADNLIVCAECKTKSWNTNEICPECGFPFKDINVFHKEEQSLEKKFEPVVTEKIIEPLPVKPVESPSQNVNITQQVVMKESNTFAVISLLSYIFVWPIGFLLNLVGLLTGPSRGCFIQLLIFFVVIPVIGYIILISMGINILSGIFDMLGDLF